LPRTEAAHLEALAELLVEPLPEERAWRVAIWEHLTQLELAPVEKVLPGWEALAQSGLPGDLANLVLYQRRHSLPLLAETAEEAADVLLERSLAAWGQRDFERTRQLLRAGLERFPSDERFITNSAWLDFQAPATLQAQGDARQWALSILAARRAQS